MPNKTRRKETRTYRDRAKYLSYATTKRRRRIKQFAIEYKGGKCMVCGYDRCVGALDLHHIGDKKFNFSTDAYLHDWDTIKKRAGQMCTPLFKLPQRVPQWGDQASSAVINLL